MVSRLPLVLVFASAVLACGPDAGNSYKKATFSFTILSPVAWSFNNGTDKDVNQQSNSTDALKKAESAVKDAISKTLKENDLSTESVNITLNYNPLKTAKIQDDCQNSKDGVYAQYEGTIYYKCGTKVAMADQTGSIVVSHDTLIPEGKWKAIAVKVQDHLEKDSKVEFEDRLKIVFG